MLNKNYYKREEYLKNNEIPMRKEIQKNLENQLTKAYFSQLKKDSKILLGLEPPLQGPGEELWVHPMDELNDNIVLKPVSTKEIQALTHTGILEYGDKELAEIEHDKQARIQKAVLENNEIWWHFTKAHTKGCVKEAVKKERDIQNRDILALVSTFNYIYKSGLDEAQTKFDKQTDVLITELRDVMKKKNCCEQDKKKMEELTAKMKEECQNRLSEEIGKLREHFDNVLMLEQARYTHEMKEKTSILRHELECRGIVDILYMACMEKHYYHLQQAERDAKHYKEIDDLLKTQDDLERELMDIKCKLEETIDENKKLKDNMRSLCQEFRRLFSCHTNLPFEQLGFLPQFEKIFIDSIYTTEKEKSDENIPEKDENAKRETINASTSKTTGESYLDGSTLESNESKKSSDKSGIYFMQTVQQEFLLGMYNKKTSQESEDSKMSVIVNAIIQQARHGLRTSILKWGQSEDELVQKKIKQLPKSFQLEQRSVSDSKQTGLHRDSVTMLIEKGFEAAPKTSVEFFKICPEPECQFMSLIDYDFPPHVAHLALTNYDKVQTFDYEDYEDYTVDELKILADLFHDAANRDTLIQPQDAEKKEPSIKQSASSKSSSRRCSKKASPKGSITQKGRDVDMEKFKDAALSRKHGTSEEPQYGAECTSEYTKEIIEQIFIDHPSLTNCVIDQ